MSQSVGLALLGPGLCSSGPAFPFPREQRCGLPSTWIYHTKCSLEKTEWGIAEGPITRGSMILMCLSVCYAHFYTFVRFWSRFAFIVIYSPTWGQGPEHRVPLILGKSWSCWYLYKIPHLWNNQIVLNSKAVLRDGGKSSSDDIRWVLNSIVVPGLFLLWR